METLPEKPIVVLEPGRGPLGAGPRELWQYRELLYILAARDVKVRYKQTVFGAAWAILQPLSAMLVFTLFFAGAAGAGADGGRPYPVFAYAGLLPWFLFSNAVNGSGNSLVGNAGLITKVYFPRIIIPIAAAGSALVDFAAAFAVLLVIMAAAGVAFTPRLLAVPPLALMTAALAIGAGMWAAALNVKYRDVRNALPFLIQTGLFVSGVIAPVPEKYRLLIYFNPIAAQIEGYRAAVFGAPFDYPALACSLVETILLLAFAAARFRRVEDEFADLI